VTLQSAKSHWRAALSAQVPVRLHVWGFTSDDAGLAREKAMRASGARRWDIIDTIETVGAPCPIRAHDTVALALGVDYETAWAVYPATEA